MDDERMNDATTTPASDYAILYVDDEELALKYFRRAIGRDFTVHVATDAQAGLDILGEHGDRIGVLVSDQRMPGESGVALLKKVRSRWPHIIRVLTTAYADLDDAIEAVNRGEIFRYITKPWDTKTLRAEIGQAMELFRLRREHAELMREKMSVWQRLVQLSRLRDLVVMSASLTHLRHADNAVIQYLKDHLAPSEQGVLSASQHLDLWQLTESEIDRTRVFIGEVVARTADLTGRDEPFETELGVDTLQRLLLAAFARVDGVAGSPLPTIRVAMAPAALMMKELAAATGDPAAAVELRATADGDAISLSVPCAPALDRGLTARAAAGLMTAYLLAFHHGGSLELRRTPDRPHYLMTLPHNPREVALPQPGAGWLASLLVRLEGWE